MKGELVEDASDCLDVTTTALAHPSPVRMRNSHGLSIIPRLSSQSNRPDAAPMPRRIPWRFVTLAIVLMLFLGWGVTSGDHRRRLLDSVSPYYPHPATTPHLETGRPYLSASLPQTKPQHPPDTADAPLTFVTDPDPTKTVHCSVPHKSGASLVQWALMIDAGSTGSRIHVYKFHNCHATPTYEYEVFRVTQPGLSAFPSNPVAAARSLDTLLDTALATIPMSMHRCTPIAVKATAGLRMLGLDKSAAILNAVRSRLESQYPFRVIENDGVAIMDGKDEGVYAWITANYLLDTLPSGAPSYAVLDLGGASTQIVFEPTFRDSNISPLAEGEHKYLLDFGGHTHVLYQHSYLGYGLMHARERVHRLVEFLHSGTESDIPNPCLARGTSRAVKLENPTRTATMVGADIGAFEACSRIVDLVLAKDAPCPEKPCSFAGVYHPPLRDAFPDGNILLLSYFFDRLGPLLPTGNTTLSLGALGAFAARVCGGEAAWDGVGVGDAPHSPGAVDTDMTSTPWTKEDAEWVWDVTWDAAARKELTGRPEHCLDLTFMHSLLRGYGLGAARILRIAKQVEGTELGWCLGATIGMLDGIEVHCIA